MTKDISANISETRRYLDETHERSSYNEGTNDQLDYYIEKDNFTAGATAYLYSHSERKLTKMNIVKTICRSDDISFYDGLNNDVLLLGEVRYNADTSAEFITDTNCYLIWFKYC